MYCTLAGGQPSGLRPAFPQGGKRSIISSSAAFPPSRHLHSCLSHAQRTSAASRRRTPSRLPRPRCRTCRSRRSRCGRNCHSWTRPRNPVRRWLSAPRRLVGGHAVSRPLHAQFIGAAHRKNDTVRRKAAVGRGDHFVQLRIIPAARPRRCPAPQPAPADCPARAGRYPSPTCPAPGG